MKLDVPDAPVVDDLLIDNGEFKIHVDQDAFQRMMEGKNCAREKIRSLWDQFVEFSSKVELSRMSGFALGSTSPIGALEDQVHRFNLVSGADLKMSDNELRAIIRVY